MTTVDLRKVQYARFGYFSRSGAFRTKKPRRPTVNGQEFDPDAMLYLGHGESMLSYARRRGLLDEWTCVISLQFAANHCVKFTGKRARGIWREWQSKMFGKRKGTT